MATCVRAAGSPADSGRSSCEGSFQDAKMSSDSLDSFLQSGFDGTFRDAFLKATAAASSRFKNTALDDDVNAFQGLSDLRTFLQREVHTVELASPPVAVGNGIRSTNYLPEPGLVDDGTTDVADDSEAVSKSTNEARDVTESQFSEEPVNTTGKLANEFIAEFAGNHVYIETLVNNGQNAADAIVEDTRIIEVADPFEEILPITGESGEKNCIEEANTAVICKRVSITTNQLADEYRPLIANAVGDVQTTVKNNAVEASHVEREAEGTTADRTGHAPRIIREHAHIIQEEETDILIDAGEVLTTDHKVDRPMIEIPDNDKEGSTSDDQFCVDPKEEGTTELGAHEEMIPVTADEPDDVSQSKGADVREHPEVVTVATHNGHIVRTPDNDLSGRRTADGNTEKASHSFSFTGLNHVAFCVENLERSLDFYCGLLGLKINLDRPELPYRGAWLVTGAEGIHIMEVPNPDPVHGRPAHGGYDRHACLNCRNVEGLRLTLEKKGISYQSSMVPSIFARDPDGNGLEFFEVDA